jgi:hypothetical protein
MKVTPSEIIRCLIGCNILLLAVAACQRLEFPSRAVVLSDANSPELATLDMTPVELYLQEKTMPRVEPFYGETMLKVPKAYLRGKQHWGGHVDSLGNVSIEAGLPDLKPWTVFGEDLFAKMAVDHKQVQAERIQDFKGAYDRAFMKDSVSIRVHYGHCFGSTRALLADLKKRAVQDLMYRDPMFEKFDIGKPSISLHFMYVPRQQGQHKTYIECPEFSSVTQRCRAITDYDAVVAFEYLFSSSRLKEYEEIEEKVRKLLDSFIQRNEPTSAMPSSCSEGVVIRRQPANSK